MNVIKNDISGDFSNAKFGDNTVLQGRDVTQTKSVTNEFPDTLFEDLIKEINNLKDQDEKTDSLDNTSKIQEAINAGNFERAKKIFGWLPEIIRTSAAAITIAKAIGLLLL